MEWWIIVCWGGLVGWDSSSFPQAMISRPLPAAVLLGLALGQPLAGAIIGVVVEAYSFSALPIGAARYPEAGTAAVAATGAYVLVTDAVAAPHLLFVAIVFTLAWEHVGGASVGLMRRLNERLAAPPTDVGSLEPSWVTRRHLAALGIDLLRALLVTTAGTVLAVGLLLVTERGWGLTADVGFGLLAAGAAGMLGAALMLFGGWAERRLSFLLGLVCGVALLLLLP